MIGLLRGVTILSNVTNFVKISTLKAKVTVYIVNNSAYFLLSARVDRAFYRFVHILLSLFFKLKNSHGTEQVKAWIVNSVLSCIKQ